MKENYEAVGFLPSPRVQECIDRDQAIIIRDYHGRAVGYLLHGVARWGHPLVVIQHVVSQERRLHGFGAIAFGRLLQRATQANCSAIRAKCAADLPSNEFWRSVGCEQTGVLHPRNIRQRDINILVYPLWKTLFDIS